MIHIGNIKNRAVTFLEDFPAPTQCVFGTHIYHFRVRVGNRENTLELYHAAVVETLKNVGSLCGKRVMIQLPEQEKAQWCARVISR